MPNVSPGQIVNLGQKENLVMRETIQDQQESIRDRRGLREVKDQSDRTESTAGLRLIIQNAQNVLKGPEEKRHNLRVAVTHPPPAGMRLPSRQRQASILSVQHLSMVPKSHARACQSVDRLKKKTDLHDQLLQGEKMTANILQGVRGKIGKSEDPSHRFGMLPSRQSRYRLDLHLPRARHVNVVVRQ